MSSDVLKLSDLNGGFFFLRITPVPPPPITFPRVVAGFRFLLFDLRRYPFIHALLPILFFGYVVYRNVTGLIRLVFPNRGRVDRAGRKKSRHEKNCEDASRVSRQHID